MMGLGLNCGEEGIHVHTHARARARHPPPHRIPTPSDDFWIEVDYIRSVLMTPEEMSAGMNKDEYSQIGEHYKLI